MRRFLGKLGGFFAVQGVLAALLAVSILRLPPSQDYLAASVRKHERLDRLPSPRIVFVGGSATAFGIDSPRIQQALARPVVNMGLYQPLGLDFILSEVEDALRPGDVVIVSPEYSMLFAPSSTDPLRQVVEKNPRAIRWLPPVLARQIIDQLHKPLGALVRRAIRESILGREQGPDAYPPYSLDSFNEEGDVVAHHRMPASAVSPRCTLGPPDQPAFRERLERLNRFHRKCVSRGITDYYSYPAAMRESVQTQRALFDSVIGELERRLEMPRLHGAEEMLFPAALFFDSPEHLRLEGKVRRTDLLLQA
ncbi:MAG TPA: hypothetical protein VKU80_05605, partial [Planctomycetota bacterium]|nr:hypothetical protein [Planctomycetota bacterium]